MANPNPQTTDMASTSPEMPLKPDALECMDVVAKWNLSMMDFYARRLRAYWRLPSELPTLLTPDDWVSAHYRFFAHTITDYCEQAETLRSLMPSDFANHVLPKDSSYEQDLLRAQRDAGELIGQAKAQAERILADARQRAEGPPPPDADDTSEQDDVRARKSA